MANIFLDWNIGVFGVPTTATATQLIIANQGGLTATVITGSGFTYSPDGVPLTGTISSVSHVLIANGGVLSTISNITVSMAAFGAAFGSIIALRDQITWANLINDEQDANFTPTLVRLTNSDGTFTDIVGTGFAETGIVLQGTVSSIRHVAADGQTVITALNGLSLALSDVANAVSEESASDTLLSLIHSGANSVTGDAVTFASDTYLANLLDGAGNDTITVGAAGRPVDFYLSPNGVTVNLDTGIATGNGTDTLIGVQNVIGSFNNDVIIGNAN